VASPGGRAAGVPGGGAVMTAADLGRFYSALLADPVGVWKPEVLADATGNIRCTFPDPLLGAPVNRTIGLVVAGDDGKHTMRYACFGAGVSPRAFGHAGAHGQVAWADPATGLAFAYLHNAVDRDVFQEGKRAVIVASRAAELVA
jgi:CubicO group peptidase (beta-lactamase class C family)